MTPKLTEEQRKAVQHSSDAPVRVEDDQTHVQYVLLRLDLYERLQQSASGASVRPTEQPPQGSGSNAVTLPVWCNVYDGMTEEEIAEIEAVILSRCSLARPA